MSYELKTLLANKSNYGSKRDTSDIKYIVIHYTANKNDKAVNNAKYFHNNIVKASAHYFVDDTEVYQSVPDNYVAWSVGGSKYSNCSTTGGGKYYGKATNSNSISVELCGSSNSTKASATTIANALSLAKVLMKKYGVAQSNIIRHFDVTGKSCPEYWCGTETKNNLWKTEFYNKLATTTTTATKKAYSGTFPTGTLKKGSKGTQVTYLQKFLNWYGSYGLTIDGDFGTNTENAVKKFQKAEGLDADGIFGSKSLAKAKAIKK